MTDEPAVNATDSRAAFDHLLGQLRPKLHRYCARMTGSVIDGEDVVQEALLKALEAFPSATPIANPEGWLFRIAHNLAMDHFRANRRWQPEEDVPEPDADESTSAEAGALESIGRKSMLELIEDLSGEQQQVLTLKFVFNFSNAEAATILGKTEGAIKSLQHRALVSLQKQIEQRDDTA